MVGSHSRLSSLQASALGAGGDEEKEVGASELVSTCRGYPEANLAYHTMSVLLRSCPSSELDIRGIAPSDVIIAALNFASLSSPSFLANSCTFLIGVWRNIRSLVQFALAMVLGRRKRVLFLVQLKNRRIFSLCSVCLRCNAHNSGGIFFVQGE